MNHALKFATERILAFGKMIKFSHTIFALPFALSAVVLANEIVPVTVGLLFWILVAMVGARSAAMGFNRIADAGIDWRNPRTADREIPAGAISMNSAIFFVIFFSLVFVLSTAMINTLCFVLSVPVLGILFFYSYTKRFTMLSHLYLGLSISLAPLGAWIAVTGGFSASPLALSLALFTYIAGFDILYACQDTEFDKKEGLHSIPARLGTKTAMRISSALHVAAFTAFFLVLVVFDLGIVYMGALAVIGLFLIVEHKLVGPGRLEKIDLAFFHTNSAISVIFLLGIAGDVFTKGI